MITVVLPSVRPHNIERAVNSITKACQREQLELIIVADFVNEELSKRNDILWIHNKERGGVITAMNEGLGYARGDYLFCTTDEAVITENGLDNLKDFCVENNDNILTCPRHIPYYPFYYYKKFFAAFPFAHRSLIEKIGGFFDPAYKSFYADPDLSMRAYQHGIEVKECRWVAVVHHNNMQCQAHKHNVSTYVEADREFFKQRWAHLGEFIDP